ncbi:MAG: cellulose biosynthesis cyclic di-GMP-binding regulatory protein BcsB [Candidatus Parcubacteria bacterium]|nr:cellulose biosynthesis cyclic di-GMP-binding regulatory protein BcsB [Leptolyngbyaceae cyanobacterium LF-bin-113]
MKYRHFPPVAPLLAIGLLGLGAAIAHAQSSPDDSNKASSVETSIVQTVESQAEPKDPAAPLPDGFVKPLTPGQYVLEFNRSPIVGHRLRLQGIYDEARLQFTRPRNWATKSAKVMLRYRHSPALYATRSNLTVLINGTSVGSLPLNRKQGEIGTAVYDIPPGVLQDYNEVMVAALQNNSPTCTQDPFDPSLWTEILPDSKLVFEVQPEPIALDFGRYPYPVFDNLSLEPNRTAYLLPEQIDEAWLTPAARLQTALGQLAQHRALETRLLKPSEALQPSERLIVIGTLKSQPALTTLKLPLSLRDGQILDEKQKVLPPDVGVLTLTTTADEKNLVLVATGNGAEGVAKAVQFLAQAHDRQIGTGRTIIVNQVGEIPTPPLREWSAYLPTTDSFQLKDLRNYTNQPFSDVTVRGADAPLIDFDFRSLPDDQFDPGNEMTLRYSYSPQVNPLTSMIEVQLDGVPITGKRLSSEAGAVRDTLQLTLPPERIKPDSKIQVRFQLDPRERRSCNRATDQQLWGTVHADTSFELKRHSFAQVPDLQLLKYGYPLAAPQDLSRTAIVVPDAPTSGDIRLMLEFSERLGRLSRAGSVKLEVYRAKQLPENVRKERHLVAIGTQSKFPLPQAFQTEGFTLENLFGRKRDQSQIQTLPDGQGVMKEIVSPWNRDRVLLALSAQTEQGLDQVRDLLSRDDLFSQIKEDTVLVKANVPNPSPYDPQAYTLEFLQRAEQKRQITALTALEQFLRFIRVNVFVMIPTTVIAAIVIYGVFQSYLKRFSQKQ